jgi:hypothetical protein
MELVLAVFDVKKPLNSVLSDKLESDVVYPDEPIKDLLDVDLSLVPHDFLGDRVYLVLGQGVLDHKSVEDGVDVDVHREVRAHNYVVVVSVLKHSRELDHPS